MKFFLWLASLFMLTLVYSCANPLSPQGGPRDEDPPLLDTLASTPNYSTRFQKKEIVFTFDEWIQLTNVNQQVVVSPPLQYNPIIRGRGKRVIFSFHEREELLDGVTYTIFFGEAIGDLNEGNKIENFKFVFSTGDFIDSNSVSGLVLDALTATPAKDVLIMMYEDLSDTVIYKGRPLYVAKSGEEGNFRIDNVKNGTFQIVALLDKNLNYQLNPSENMGFLSENLLIQDSSVSAITIFSSVEDPPLRILSHKRSYAGKISLVLNRPPNGELLWIQPSEVSAFFSSEIQDSVHFWFAPPVLPDWQLILRQNDSILDTIDVFNSSEFVPENLVFKGRRSQSLAPNENVALAFNTPLVGYDSSMIRFTDTSGAQIGHTTVIDTADPRILRLRTNSRIPGIKYQLVLQKGAVESWMGQQSDSLVIEVRFREPEEFGNLSVDLSALDQSGQYILQLVRNNIPVQEEIVRNNNSATVDFRFVAPSTYLLRLVRDENSNGKWDPGSFMNRRQPEKVAILADISVRANWDVSVSMSGPN